MILQQQDSVGLVVFDDAVRRYLKPAGSPSQLKEVVRLLDVTPAREKSDLGVVFHELAERFKKRGIVAVFSDLFDDVEKVVSGLKHFRHRRHEVIVFHILDPAEIEFPFRDTTLFKGLEDATEDPHRSARASSAPTRQEVKSFLKRDRESLPDGRHRLRAATHRPEPWHRAVQLPRVAVGENPLELSARLNPDRESASVVRHSSGPWVLPTSRSSTRWRRRRCRW